MESFSALTKTDINSTTPSRQRHAVFHSFLSYDSKQYAATNTAHRKRLILLLSDKKVIENHWLQYGNTLMVMPNNKYVPLKYILFQLCLSVTP